ncbi:uncharacterized protein Z518_08728 [Rhinocladiella mackenziei CBS 650.93]|uniref:Heterokaryon incompatibility domain-containing protein n=1 Tax=Rhinocladiella mackenziei CBS 650.93 TaxID=1442369 RepID=A0A0D2IHK5_9EURO|nr:uncharacterized protein Z518_08728 [Rhinocladiella mackenziei CBS 650.93]KIX02786.1 hypothetical protein Z518_08728 [Rhinocladiella mackenziei CBS 650.93]
MDEFRHERLKLSGSFMRLLQIQGGTKKDIISLRITQYAIHRRPAYVAISYTWGNAEQTREIRVNGRPFRVRVNLWNLLLHLRQRGEWRFLWIDALCIDQQNLEERNFHVQLMGRIYDSSERAIVWLGLPSEDRRQARVMEFISEMASYRKKHSPSAFRDLFLVDAFAQRWTNLLELCRCTYWTRTWIIQEFVQASDIEAVCGTASLDWKNFEDVVRSIREMSLSSTSEAPLPPFVQQFMQTIPFRLTSRRIAHTESTLEELLSEFYDSRCAERRDKIYGVLGIADDCGEDPATGVCRGPRPDYSKHIVEVYFEVFKYLRPSPMRPNLPLQAVCLAQKALEITQADIASYVAPMAARGDENALLNTNLSELSCPLVPDYVNVIDEILPGWTSMRDLRQRLEQVDWAKYVGHEVKRKTLRPPQSSQRKSSFTTPSNGGTSSKQTEYIRAPLPADLVENVLDAASHSDELLHLYNYPSSQGCMVPVEHILLHTEDKRRASNPNLLKPSIVIESNPALGVDPVRVGFACTDVRPGDLICQFHGVDVTLIARRVGGGGDLKLVGLAKMISHLALKEKGAHPGCKSGDVTGKGWSGIVHSSKEQALGNEENWQMRTDPLSLWEVLGAG